MKHLKVTIVNDEPGDTGPIMVRVMDAKGQALSEDRLEEGSEEEVRFTDGESIVISAA
ncbi:hypothetical protein [Luteibacter sp. ME-Dv--P-043b]|uniref:hypothetical protein n=1 Tax=Luteibacter sp. ME-Dv--P-043b TaxID=3040291 RepID=UPI0025557517|nr:hypothetical protein [Luteibacter sp. ME-Dv--P-043b]